MDATNWEGFIKVSCEAHNGKVTPALLAKRLYLKIAGAMMGVIESVQRKSPNSTLARSLGHLSPITPAARRSS